MRKKIPPTNGHAWLQSQTMLETQINRSDCRSDDRLAYTPYNSQHATFMRVMPPVTSHLTCHGMQRWSLLCDWMRRCASCCILCHNSPHCLHWLSARQCAAWLHHVPQHTASGVNKPWDLSSVSPSPAVKERTACVIWTLKVTFISNVSGKLRITGLLSCHIR